MGPARNHKRKASMLQKESMQQQNISAMLGERVTKPRTFTDAIPPMPKRRKADMVGAPLEVPMAKEPVASGNSTVMAQKRKWRLSEVLERDREARKKRTQRTPAFVFLAPHMDSKRPDAGSNQPPLPPPREVRTKKKKGLKQVRFAIDETYPTPSKGLSSSSTCVHIREKSRATEVRRASSVSGGEAILYNRDMLPKSHSLLLNVLIGLESAIALLKTRRTLPTVSAVREIVQRSTKRNFTSQILSQLAHIVPEAIAVVPGISSTTKKKAGLDSYIIRLDDVDFAENSGARTAPEKNGNSVSVLGDSAVRIRRSLLHKRLLAHVKEEHEKFLANSSISRHDGDLWHEDFDLERDVEELPSPPLYSTCDISPAPSYANGRPPQKGNDIRTVDKDQTKDNIADAKVDTSEESNDSDIDDCIPASLLHKVRVRSDAQKVHAAKVENEKTTNRSLLSKLPVTMDTVCSVLRTERRTAVGWSQLIQKVEKLHPKKWSKEDLGKQLDAIAVLGSDWCKKVELKSSRGGYAFRVHSECKFVEAREKVSSTTSYSVDS